MELENICWIEMLSPSGYLVISAEGFRFLILPVQLTPFPIYPGSHVQM